MRTIIGMISALLLSVPAFAVSNQAVQSLVYRMVKQQQIQFAKPMGLKWTVGDHAEYSLNAGILSGTVDMKITDKVSQGFWMEQDMDLGVAGKHVVRELIDPSNGHVIQVTMDGKPQTPPTNDPEQIIKMKHEQITVKAGSFAVVYLQVKDNKTGDVSELWINPQLIPIAGMAKSIQPSQLGPATLELLSFGFAN